LQAIGCAKINLNARLKYSEILVTRDTAEKNAASALQSCRKQRATVRAASICKTMA
jgi:hypothetical protein